MKLKKVRKIHQRLLQPYQRIRRDERCVALYHAGVKGAEIARMTGVTPAAVYLILRRQGVTPDRFDPMSTDKRGQIAILAAWLECAANTAETLIRRADKLSAQERPSYDDVMLVVGGHHGPRGHSHLIRAQRIARGHDMAIAFYPRPHLYAWGTCAEYELSWLDLARLCRQPVKYLTEFKGDNAKKMIGGEKK